jgi:hypothetical protein
MKAQHRVALLVGIVLAFGSSTCRQPEKNGLVEAAAVSDKTIEQVQQEHTEAWMSIPGVVGTALGQCEGKPCILVLTAANTEEVRRTIPSTVEGYPVVVQYTGEIHARQLAP